MEFFEYLVASDFSTFPGMAVPLGRTKDRREGRRGTAPTPTGIFYKKKQERPRKDPWLYVVFLPVGQALTALSHLILHSPGQVDTPGSILERETETLKSLIICSRFTIGKWNINLGLLDSETFLTVLCSNPFCSVPIVLPPLGMSA